MADRQNGILIGVGAALLDGVLKLIGNRGSNASVPLMPVSTAGRTGVPEVHCAACRKSVDVGVGFCPHYGTRLTWGSGVATGADPSKEG